MLRLHPALLQEACLKNLKEQAKVKEVLLSYHPFWLRLGMEVVANRVVAGELWAGVPWGRRGVGFCWGRPAG